MPTRLRDSLPVETIARRLDLLPGVFASTIVRVEPKEMDRTIEDLLGQIGIAFEADQTTFESSDTAAGGSIRSWIRPGAMFVRDAGFRIPVPAEGRAAGGLSVACREEPRAWPSAVVERLQLLASLMELAVQRGHRARAEASTREAAAPVGVSMLVDDDGADSGEFEDIIGDSPALRMAMARVQEVAPTGATVVLMGETGTGKELFARAVHKRSARHAYPFVPVNCAALPPTLIESELFGHERGAFTGAVAMRRGRFELADKGTLFLDEIGDLPADVQAKLLRVLQEGEFERVGSSQTRRVDARLVAATHHDLEAAVREGRFRADLYYRLNVFPIALPPLRERVEDIPRLVWFFINRRQRVLNRRFTSVPAKVLEALQRHSWPGNVRELENVVERAMIHSSGDTLLLDDGPGQQISTVSSDTGTLESVERRHIENMLRRCRWRINGPGNAAEVLGLHPNTLRFRMKKLGIERPARLEVVRDFKRPA